MERTNFHGLTWKLVVTSATLVVTSATLVVTSATLVVTGAALVVTGATLVVTGALLVVTKKLVSNKSSPLISFVSWSNRPEQVPTRFHSRDIHLT